MNYLKIYEQIINRAQSQSRIKLPTNNPNYVYYENHHIVPKSLGGNNDLENLVLLSAREHFITHKLLTFIYPNCRKMTLAYSRMTFSKKLGNILTSRDYQYAKELLSKNGPSEITRKKISKAQKGRNKSEEFKKKVSKGMKGVNIGKTLSEEHKKKLSDAKKGVKNPNKNGLSDEHKEKIRQSNLGLKRGEETRKRMSKSMKGRIPWNKGNKNN